MAYDRSCRPHREMQWWSNPTTSQRMTLPLSRYKCRRAYNVGCFGAERLPVMTQAGTFMPPSMAYSYDRFGLTDRSPAEAGDRDGDMPKKSETELLNDEALRQMDAASSAQDHALKMMRFAVADLTERLDSKSRALTKAQRQREELRAAVETARRGKLVDRTLLSETLRRAERRLAASLLAARGLQEPIIKSSGTSFFIASGEQEKAVLPPTHRDHTSQETRPSDGAPVPDNEHEVSLAAPLPASADNDGDKSSRRQTPQSPSHSELQDSSPRPPQPSRNQQPRSPSQASPPRSDIPTSLQEVLIKGSSRNTTLNGAAATLVTATTPEAQRSTFFVLQRGSAMGQSPQGLEIIDVQALVDENAAQRRTIAALQHRLFGVIAELRITKDTEQDNKEQLSALLRLPDEMAQLRAENAALRSSLDAERERLDRFGAVRRSPSSSDSLRDFVARIDSATQGGAGLAQRLERQSLQLHQTSRELEEARRAQGEGSLSSLEVGRLEAERMRLAGARDADRERITGLEKSLEESKVEFLKRLGTMQTHFEEADAQRQRAEKKLAISEAEAQRLRIELDEKIDLLAKAQHTILDLSPETREAFLDALALRVRSADSQVVTLQKQLAEIRAQKRELEEIRERQKEHLSEAHLNVTRMEETLCDIRKQLGHRDEQLREERMEHLGRERVFRETKLRNSFLERELRTHVATIKALETEIADLLANRETFKDALRRLGMQYKQKDDALQQTEEELTREKFTSARLAEVVQREQGKIADLHKEKVQQSAAVAELMEKLEAADIILCRRETELRETTERLESKSEELRELLDRSAELEGQLSSLETSLGDRRRDRTAKDERLAFAERQRQLAEERYDTLRGAHSQLQEKLLALERELSEIRPVAEQSRLSASREAFLASSSAEQLKKQMAEASDLRDRLAEVQREAASLRRQLSAEKGEREQILRELVELKSRDLTQKGTMTELEQQLLEVAKQKDEAIEELKKQVSRGGRTTSPEGAEQKDAQATAAQQEGTEIKNAGSSTVWRPSYVLRERRTGAPIKRESPPREQREASPNQSLPAAQRRESMAEAPSAPRGPSLTHEVCEGDRTRMLDQLPEVLDRLQEAVRGLADTARQPAKGRVGQPQLSGVLQMSLGRGNMSPQSPVVPIRLAGQLQVRDPADSRALVMASHGAARPLSDHGAFCPRCGGNATNTSSSCTSDSENADQCSCCCGQASTSSFQSSSEDLGRCKDVRMRPFLLRKGLVIA